jgi:hypothetical protein
VSTAERQALDLLSIAAERWIEARAIKRPTDLLTASVVWQHRAGEAFEAAAQETSFYLDHGKAAEA